MDAAGHGRPTRHAGPPATPARSCARAPRLGALDEALAGSPRRRRRRRGRARQGGPTPSTGGRAVRETPMRIGGDSRAAHRRRRRSPTTGHVFARTRDSPRKVRAPPSPAVVRGARRSRAGLAALGAADPGASTGCETTAEDREEDRVTRARQELANAATSAGSTRSRVSRRHVGAPEGIAADAVRVRRAAEALHRRRALSACARSARTAAAQSSWAPKGCAARALGRAAPDTTQGVLVASRRTLDGRRKRRSSAEATAGGDAARRRRRRRRPFDARS